MIDLGVLVTKGRWQRLQGGLPAKWWEEAWRHEQGFGVRRLFFCAGQLESGGERATAIMAGEQGPEEVAVGPLPRIWFNDLAAPTAAEARLLRNLNGQPDLVIFNESNRFNRPMLNAMLAAKAELRPLLSLADDAQEQPGIYLLAPRRGPTRRAVWLNAQPGSLWRYRPATGERCELRGRLRDVTPFFAEQGGLLRLPAWPEGPVEWRFYLQRPDPGEWTVAAEVAKLDCLRESGKRERCWTVPDAAGRLFGGQGAALAERMRHAAATVVRTLSRFQPGLVHCAVDLWVTGTEEIHLADVTGRYRTDWLAKSGQAEALTRVSQFPLRFAAMLSQTGVEKLHVDYARAGQPHGAGPAPARVMLQPGSGAPTLRRRKRHGDCDDPCPPCEWEDC